MRSIALFLSVLFLVGSLLAQENPASAVDVPALRARAEAGDAKAELQLAHAYQNGVGVSRSEREAMNWLRKAAEVGDPAAEAELGYAYRTGEGVEKDFHEAMTWYAKAAAQGHANAMFNMATFYYNGDGINVDDTEAYMWFSLAQLANSKPAEEAIARMDKNVLRSRIADAKFQMANVLAEGSRVPRNTQKALALYDEVAATGGPDVQMSLAKIFIKGWGVAQDGAKAESYCLKALAQRTDYAPAMLCLAYLNQAGFLGSVRDKEAVTWYEKAFKLGNPIAAYGLGAAYATGQGVKQDFPKAFELLVIASVAKIEIAAPLAKEVEQKLPPETAKKIIKKVNEPRNRAVYTLGMTDKQFSYVVKVDHLP